MPIKLAIAGRSLVTVSDEHIPIGSDPCCAVVFSDETGIKPIHAVIKEVSGRWLIEACDTELVTVGNAEPGRRHWLKPGDVIRLSKNSPAITFQPADDDDDLLPLVPRFADSLTTPLSSKKVVPLNGGVLQSDTVDMAMPTTSVSIPTTRAPESGTIPTARAMKSGTIPIPKSDSSANLPTAKRPSSGTIKSVKGPGESSRKSSVSDAEIPVRRPKKSGSSGQIPARKPVEDEIEQDLPVLTRLSSWDEELEPAPRRRRSSEKEEMDWIMNVVLRCVGVGAVVLVLLIVVNSLWKALNQPGAGLPNAPQVAGADSNATGRNSVVTSPPPTQIPPRPKNTPAATAKSDAQAGSSIDLTGETTETEVSATESPDMEESDGADSMTDAPDDLKLMDSDDLLANSQIDKGQLSSTAQATSVSLYAVMMQDSTGTQQYHIGTAWAASDRHLVTSGKVATEMKALQKKGFTATAVQPSSDWAIRIKGARIHPKYVTAAVEVADPAVNQNEKRLAQARTKQLRHSLAVLDVDAAHQLESPLPLVVKPLKTTTETIYAMVGFPQENHDGKPPVFSEVGPLQECRSKRLSPTSAIRLKEPVMNIKFLSQLTEQDWSGSPVLNKDNQVIGVYAQLPSQVTAAGKRDRPEYVVVWLGLLREVASDVFKKAEIKPPMDQDR